MADIRINSLPTTASASSSNDFLAIDGATNGTRKLSAYNPTFGGAVTVNGTGTYGAIQLPSGTTSIYGVAFGTDTNLWRTDSGNLELGGSSVALIGLNVGGTNKGYFYNNGTDTTLAGAGTLTFKSNSTTTGLTLDSSNATVAGTITVSGTTDSSSKDTGAIVTEGGLGVEKSATFGGNLTVSGVAYVADGSSAVPSIAFANDTDTGFSRAAANAFDVGTGGFTNTRFTGVASANRYLNVSNASGGGSPFISAEGGNSTGLLLKTTNSSGVATTALTLDGTQAATLTGNLTVSGTGTSAIQGETINLGAVGNVATVVNLYRNNAAVGGLYAGNYDFNLFGGTSAASHLVIKNTGNVGIGTTSPVALLTLNSGSSGGAYTTGLQISRNGDNSSGGLRIWHSDSGLTSEYFDSMYDSASSSINFRTRVLGTPINAVTILGSGNVLIGTSTDGGQKLQVNGTMSIYGASTADTFTVTRASNTANGMLKFITTSTEDWIVGQRNTSDSDFHFYSYGISADALKLERSTGNATFAGSIQTAAPSGGSAIAWKLGVRVLATTTLDTTQYLQVDVGGTLYKVALVTS